MSDETSETVESPPRTPDGSTDVTDILSVADILERIAVLETLGDIANERIRELRAGLRAKADQIAADTGAAANFPVRGLGRAYVTSPKEIVAVRDQQRFLEWAASAAPNAIQTSRDVSATRLLEACDADPDLDKRLRDLGVLRTITSPNVDAIDDAMLEDLHRTTSGMLVDEQGEYTGLVLQLRSRPTLTVRIDEAAKRRYRAMIAGGRMLGAVTRVLEAPGSDPTVKWTPANEPPDPAGDAVPVHRLVCLNCGQRLVSHCVKHQVPCCPGKCTS